MHDKTLFLKSSIHQAEISWLIDARAQTILDEMDKLDESVKVIRDNIVHFSRDASMYEHGEFWIPAELEKNLWTIKRPLFPLLPRELKSLLPIYIKHEEVKRWIEKRLEKDPDWFMPHFFWVRLGLNPSPERKELESVEHVSPPFFHEMIPPKLPKEFANFDSMIRYVVRKEDEKSARALCMWIEGSSDWRSRDFYESWRILRRVHEAKIGEEPKFRNIAKILDAALLEYVIADHNPNVDLQSVFNDYLISEDAETVIREIKGGKYRRTCASERREAMTKSS